MGFGGANGDTIRAADEPAMIPTLGPPLGSVKQPDNPPMDDSRGAAPVTVVVVNFNGGENLRRCLEQLAVQTVRPERIIVVDNASTDGSLTTCQALVAKEPLLADRTIFDEVRSNIGFAAACNRGIAGATTEFIALLNPDAFPEPGWLAAILAAAAAHPECAAFGSRQMLAGKPGHLDGIGDRWHISGLSWREGHGRPVEPADLTPREIFSPCAAAAVYRRAAVNDVGGFDEDYFCFGEDVDLGYRLRLRGYRSRSVPDAVVEHIGGGSTPSATATYLGHRNTLWTLVKDTPWPLLAVSLLGHGCQSILGAVVLGCRGQGQAFLRGKWDALRGLPAAWRKRRHVQAGRKVSTWAICRMIDMGWSRRHRSPR
jgi:GT2 family glycosyltransferase